MSRGDELRQLAAQLSVLAALEDSVALGLSRVMGPAGSGPRPATRSQRLCCALRVSPLPPVGLALAPAPLRAAEACKASQLQHRLWFAGLGGSRGDGTGHGLGLQVLPASPSSPAAPLPRFSRSPRCFSRLVATCRRLRAPCTAETVSNSDDDWDALLDAHGLTTSSGGAAAAVAQPADAAGASRRARDKRRRRQRKAAKRSMWREI